MNMAADERRVRAAAEAADWLQRLESASISEAERGEFVDWLRESPVHVAEMLKLGMLVSELAALKDWDRQPVPQLPPAENVVSLDAFRPVIERTEDPGRGRTLRIAGLAAAVALLGVVALQIGNQAAETVIHTQAGESRRITLEDGSVVRVLPGTDLRVQYGRELRAVSIDRGQAIFHVAKDPDRPFIVEAAQTRVQAVGTIFSVQRLAESVVVAVAEGRVRVRPPAAVERGAAGTAAVEDVALRASERISVSASGVASPISHVEVDSTDDWAGNQLVFENARVEDVVARFNRRNDLQIRVTDRALASRMVSGVFDGDDPRSFVDFLEKFAGVSSVSIGLEETAVTPEPALLQDLP